MKKVIYSIVMLVLLSGTAMCQSTSVIDSKGTPAPNPDKNGVYTQSDVMPKFKGGNDAFFKYLSENLKYPVAAKDAKIQGAVYARFVVNAEGKIGDVEILRPIGGGCDEEAKRVVESMPDWIPGSQNGKNVSVRYTLPIKFKLDK